MKYFLFILLFLFFHTTKSFAQDTIIKQNGDTIISKILEVGETEITFKKFKFLNGPNYVVSKSEMKYILYANGVKEIIGVNHEPEQTYKSIENKDDYRAPVEVSTKIEDLGNRFNFKNRTINEDELHSVLLQTGDKNMMGLVVQSEKSKGLQNIGFGVIPFAIGATIAIPYWVIYAMSYNNNWGPQYTLAERNKYASLAAVCVVGTISCPVISGVFSNKRKSCNRKAIALYNQKY